MPNLDRSDLVKRYQAGQSFESIARDLGTYYTAVRLPLLEAAREGLIAIRRSEGAADAAMERRHGKTISEIVNEMASAYAAGESLKSLEQRFGMAKPAIANRLHERGVEIRDASAAAKRHRASLTQEERCQATEAAHAAVRGVRHTPEHRAKVALANSLRPPTSPLEIQLGGWLAARAVAVSHQHPVGRYNLDLALVGPDIAVEINGGNWHSAPERAARDQDRKEYILDRGWFFVTIWVVPPRRPLTQGAADYLIALRKALSGGETGPERERVIWGDGHPHSVRKRHVHDRPAVAGTRSGIDPGTPNSCPGQD